MNQGFLSPSAMLSLGAVAELRGIEVADGGELRLGATVTHREVERDARVREGWPVLAHAFGARRQPARAQPGDRRRRPGRRRLRLRPARRARRRSAPARCCARPAASASSSIDELILGYYETCIAPDELLVEVRVPPAPERAVYRKFRSRSSEDRPCVAVAATRDARRAARRRRRRRRDAAALPRRVRARRRPCIDRALATEIGRGATPSASSRSTTPAARPPTAAASPPSRSAARSRRWRVSAIGIDARVTGAQAYSVDVERPGMLHAAFVRSPHAHARVLSVDASDVARRLRRADAGGRRGPRALRLPGARPARARGRRAPRRRRRRRGRRADAREQARAATRLIAGRVRGAARRLRRRRGGRARRAAAAPRMRRTSADEAVSIGVRPLPGHQRLPPLPARERRRRGRLRRGRRRSSRRRSARRAPRTCRWSRTPRSAEWEDGRLTVWAGTQTPFNTRADLAGLFGLDARATCGSSRRRWAARSGPRRSCAPRRIVAALARKAQRPVKVVLDRTEEFVTLNRHPATIRVRIGAKQRRHARGQGGRLLGRHGRLRRLRAGRRDEARLRRRRPLPDPARARRLAGDLHEPAAQRRLPRLRGDAVGLGVASARWTCSPSAWA